MTKASVEIGLILSSGDALFIGRGQQHILGYGALIYVLEWFGLNHPNEKTDVSLARVKKYVFGFRRADGSFPLRQRHR